MKKAAPKKTAQPKQEEKVAKKAVAPVAKKAKKAAAASSDVYAIVQTGGKQYQVIPGKTVAVEKLEGNAGDKVTFNEVVFRKSADGKFEFGQPFIKGASVKANIIKQSKGEKVIVFKFQRRKKRRTKTGHRQPVTIVRIETV